tara:strand:- start:250 stop:618 length:369 start_codon:yes stop_codon:yes gene_type:complete
MIDKILHVIERDGLKKKDRHREMVHKRAFLFAILREEKYPLNYIGKLFNLHHATVIHGIKNYHQWMKIKDPTFLEDVQDYMVFLDYYDKYIPPKRDIMDDVMRCQDLIMLNVIKKRIQNGRY